MTRILPVVEGDGDLAAVPELLRRVLADMGRSDVQVCRPHKRGDLPKVLARFEAFLQVALLDATNVLWVLDYDCSSCNDMTRDMKILQSKARSVANHAKVEFVFMVQEFETIFLADEVTTREAFPDIPVSVQFPAEPEGIRDAKGWLSKARPKGSAYKPTQHQAKLAARVDLSRLRLRCPSYIRLEAAVAKLVSGATL